VGFLFAMAFLLHPAVHRKSQLGKLPWYDALLALVGFLLGFYHWIFEADLIQRSGDPTFTDLAVGTVVVVLLFEAARRVLGAALPVIAAIFLAYGFFGQYLPDVLGHRPFGYDQVISQLYLGVEGIYGIPTLVSATYIFLFILFGSFLEHAGMIRLFNNVALGLVGGARGGPAKVAVISSGFMDDSIILAVEAPTPETLISCTNSSFSTLSKNPYSTWASSLICRYVSKSPLSRF